MNTIQQEQYISIQQGCQQMKICGGKEFSAEKNELFRFVYRFRLQKTGRIAISHKLMPLETITVVFSTKDDQACTQHAACSIGFAERCSRVVRACMDLLYKMKNVSLFY